MQPLVSAHPGSFVWTQILTVLVVGLLTAFAFQLLLTNLGIAIGVSALSLRSRVRSRAESSTAAQEMEEDARPDAGSEISVSKISAMAGFGILLTINTVLFAACFLATKFSQLDNPMSGAIGGIAIWSAYFLLLLWISSTAVTSLVGSILDITTGGLRRIVSTIAAAFSRDEDRLVTEEQMLAAMRQEMKAALSPETLQHMIEEQMQAIIQSSLLPSSLSAPSDEPASDLPELQSGADLDLASEQDQVAITELWQKVEEYLHTTSAKSLTPKRIDRKLQKVLQKTQLRLSDETALPAIDRPALMQLLEQRQDLSSKRKNRIIHQVEETWERFVAEHSPPDSAAELPTQESDVDETTESWSQSAVDLLQSASGTAIDQVLVNAPKILQHIKSDSSSESGLAALVLPIALAKIRNAIEPITAKSSDVSDILDIEDVSEYLDLDRLDYSELKQDLKRLLTYSQSNLTNLNQLLRPPVERLHDRIAERVEAIQATTHHRIEQLKQRTQQRIEETQKAAATAAWWLFFTISTGAISSALAGALATGFEFTHWLSW